MWVSRALHVRDEIDTGCAAVAGTGRRSRYLPGMRSVRLAVTLGAVLATVAPARADAGDDVERLLAQATARVDDARRLRELVAAARELGYADPRQVEWALYNAFDPLLADPVLGPLLTNLMAQYRGGFVRVAVDAGASADRTTLAAASAAAAAAYELPLCRVVGARAAALGGWEDGAALASYVLTGSACLPLPANTLEVAYTRRGNVRTSLLTVPVVLDERRSGDVYDFDLRFYRYRGEHHEVDVMPFIVHIDAERDAEGGGFGAITSRVEGAPVVWRRRGKGLAGADQVYRFMGFDLRYQDDDGAVGGRDAGAFTLVPLALEGVMVTPELAASVGGGYVRAAGVERQGDMDVDVVEETGAVAWFQLDGVMGPVRGQLRLARDYLPTFDAQIVVDDRLSTRLDVTLDRAAIGATVFAARDQVVRDTDAPPAELVTGGGLDAVWSFGRGLHALARVEGAHALIAGRAADPVETRFEVRATAGLAYHWDRRWPPAAPAAPAVTPATP